MDASYNDDWLASGNEPSFSIPWVYNWVGSPNKTQFIINKILTEQYFNKNEGLPGNDDLGAMGAWYVFASIGLYPEIPGVGGFSINTPIFSDIIIHLEKGDLQITGGGEKDIFIDSLYLNGESYKSTWINWKDISQGGVMKFKTNKDPENKWEITVQPPSFD